MSRVETPKSVKEEVKLLFPSMTLGIMDWPKAIQCMRGQVTSGKWEDTPGTASAIASVLVGGDNPLTQVCPTNNTTVTKYLDALKGSPEQRQTGQERGPERRAPEDTRVLVGAT